MSEVFESESDAQALGGSTLSRGLPIPATDGADWHGLLNLLFERMNRAFAVLTACEVYKDGDLTYAVRSGSYNQDGEANDYAGSTGNALTDDEINYIYLDADAALQTNITGFPDTEHFPLARIAVGDDSALGTSGLYDLCDITDWRDLSMFRTVGQDTEREHQVPLTLCRDTSGNVLDSTGGAGLFAIALGAGIQLDGEDAQSNTKTDILTAELMIPWEYIASETVKVNVRARYAGAGTIGTKTLDLECYEIDEDGAEGADICATGIQALTSSLADYEFTITDAGLAPGDKIKLKVTAVVQETGGADPLNAEITKLSFNCDVAA